MNLRHFLVLSLLCGAPLTGCTVENERDNPELSEDALTSFERLDAVRAGDVAATFAAEIEASIKACRQANPAIDPVTKQNLSKFTTVGSRHHLDLGTYLEKRLAKVPSLPVATLGETAEADALAELRSVTGDAIIDYDALYRVKANQRILLDYYSAFQDASEAAALKRVRNPAGVDVRAMRAQWTEVQIARGNLDSSFLNPVAFAKRPTLGDLRKALKIRGSMASWGTSATTDFGEAGEGPEGAPEYGPLAAMVNKPGIVRRYYITNAGENWSRNYLILVDANHQAYGFMMGYSE